MQGRIPSQRKSNIRPRRHALGQSHVSPKLSMYEVGNIIPRTPADDGVDIDRNETGARANPGALSYTCGFVCCYRLRLK